MNALFLAASLAGLDVPAVGEENLRKALALGRARLGLDEAAYLALLARDAHERRLLAGRAVVQETWLLRDPEAFAGLARLAVGLSPPVRVLCVPCATGEEPASVAATLVRAGLGLGDFTVDAVDANPEALALARLGRFGPSCLRGGQETPGPPFFEDAGGVALDPAVLSRIRFFEADALAGDFLAGEAPYQAVFCRHLLIYLNAWARERLADNLGRLLAPEGALFTSPAEAAAFTALGLPPYPRAVAAPEPPAAQPERPPVVEPAPAANCAQPPAPGAVDALPARQDDAVAKARSLADAGRIDEALNVIDAAIESGCASAALYHLKGAALLASGNAEPARDAFRRAVYLDPGHVESLTHLELMARAEGRRDEALLLAGRVRRAEEARS